VIYISDFEIADIQGKINIQIKPLATYNNLNILAQKGIWKKLTFEKLLQDF
jgi:hypothetical protein